MEESLLFPMLSRSGEYVNHKSASGVSGGRVDDPEEEAETSRPLWTTAARLDIGEVNDRAQEALRCRSTVISETRSRPRDA